MCAVSAIGDYANTHLPGRYPKIFEGFVYPNVIGPTTIDSNSAKVPQFATTDDIVALRKEMQELRILIMAAKDFDTKTGQHDCQHGEKVALIKKFAEIAGVSMDDLL